MVLAVVLGVVNAAVWLQCNEPNDLLDLIRASDPSGRYACSNASLESLLAAAQPRDAVFSLAPGYPSTPTVVSGGVLATAKAKGVMLYVEYPTGTLYNSTLQRAVVAAGGVFETLKEGKLLNPHAVPFVTPSGVAANITRSLLHFAKVAGYDTLADGLPATGVTPFLWEGGGALFAATQLSSFSTQRYAPVAAWQEVLTLILQRGGINNTASWTPPVRPAFARDAVLPPDAQKAAVLRGVGWYEVAGMLPDASRLYQSIPAKKGSGRMQFPPFSGNATGRMGVFEGHASTIDLQGNQPTGVAQRDDCMTETAMAFAVLSSVQKDNDPAGAARSAGISSNILDYAWVHGGFSKSWQPGVLDNPNGDFFGILEWSAGTNASAIEFYKDDDARALLAGIATSAFLSDTHWDGTIALGTLANLRLTGPNGFGPSSDTFPKIAGAGWESYYNKEWAPMYSPHYQAYLWAVYLWAYKVSGYQPLYDRAMAAIRIMMDGYPAKWIPTANGITMQRARMLLPLAWLARVDNTSETRGWLRTMADGLLSRQHPCGAFQEEVSAEGWGGAARVPDNTNYGTFESPLNQENTDPVADMLYTQNFALLGLTEAAAVLPDLASPAAKLADFLTRIQSRSAVHPEFDGAYFRAFDFAKWEVWASDADLGWGAWSTETGWTQSWITSTLGMRYKGTTLWDASLDRPLGHMRSAFEDWIPFMFPQ
eukprot:Hpha_TRINITY_DN23611_c0_g1::TRINITY_DN23611_c0_g1_i1::g.57513::m.57513